MLLLNYPQAGYVPLTKSNTAESRVRYGLCEKSIPKKTKKWRNTSIAVLYGLACFTAGFVGNMMTHNCGNSGCENLSRRQEWRSLSTEGRLEYIDAFWCLSPTSPRQLSQDAPYDDIVYVYVDRVWADDC